MITFQHILNEDDTHITNALIGVDMLSNDLHARIKGIVMPNLKFLAPDAQKLSEQQLNAAITALADLRIVTGAIRHNINKG